MAEIRVFLSFITYLMGLKNPVFCPENQRQSDRPRMAYRTSEIANGDRAPVETDSSAFAFVGRPAGQDW